MRRIRVGDRNRKVLRTRIRISLLPLCALVVIGGVRCNSQSDERPEDAIELCEAIADGNIDLVKGLVSRGTNVNAQDPNGTAPLHYAVEWGDPRIVRLLLDKGANPNVRRWGTTGSTPLAEAIHQRYEGISLLLISRGANVNEPVDADFGTLLSRAIGRGWPHVVKELIANGADVNASDPDGDTPLHHAAISGDITMLKTLLSNGADRSINAPNDKGETPLHVSGGPIRKLLLARGATTGVPLLDAMANGDWVKTKGLLKSDPNLVKAVDSFGWTALHWAAYEGDGDLVRYILKRGANPNALDNDRRGPLYLACLRDDPVIAKLILAHGAVLGPQDRTTISSFIAAVRWGHLEIVELLLDGGADANTKVRDLETVLYTAVRAGQVGSASLLISRGAEVNARNRGGRTPLHVAVRECPPQARQKMVSLLLSKGADVRIKDNVGRTALDWAREVSPDLVEILD